MKLVLLETLTGHDDRVWCVSWDPTGTLLATCGSDKTIRIWTKEGNKWITKSLLTDSHEKSIRSLGWSYCGNYLASVSFDGTTSIWQKKTDFERCSTLEGHENEVKGISWSRSGRYLATCGRDKTVWVWEVDDTEEFECTSVLSNHTQDVKNVAWHPFKDILASCSYDDSINLYKEDDDDFVKFSTLKGHSSTVWNISFNAAGDKLASCSQDKTVKIWKDITNGENNVENCWQCVATLGEYHERPIYDICWCKLSNRIATGCADNGIKVFKETTEQTIELETKVVNAHLQDINSIDWNPKVEGLLASGSDDHQVKLWQLTSD